MAVVFDVRRCRNREASNARALAPPTAFGQSAVDEGGDSLRAAQVGRHRMRAGFLQLGRDGAGGAPMTWTPSPIRVRTVARPMPRLVAGGRLSEPALVSAAAVDHHIVAMSKNPKDR
jgi:hypothetical protein